MGHGIAEGVSPTAEELGHRLEAMTGGQRQVTEGILVASGQEEVRVTLSFTRDKADWCILDLRCEFPGSEDHSADLQKVARAEAELRNVLAGYPLPPGDVLFRKELDEDDNTAPDG